MLRYRSALLALLLMAAGPVAAKAQEDGASDSSELSQEQSKIEAAVASYVAAFNSKDVDKLISHWSPNAVYISRATGERIVGRAAMTEEFTAILSNPEAPQLAVQTESIEFISPNVAVERGVATVTRSDGEDNTSYRAVYVKREQQWLIDRITEEPLETVLSNYERLQNLEFLIGEWVDSGPNTMVEFDCRWTENQNYISRIYRVMAADQSVVSSGLQIIGWDAKQEQIRSWLFDSEGSFVSGTWAPRETGWVVQSIATLSDGTTGSYTTVFTPTEEGNYRWQKINRVLDGNLLPNVDETTVVPR